MSIRLEFVAEAFAQRRPFAALCAQYAISEKTGYKWLARFRRDGPPGLEDLCHRPRSCPHQTPVRQRELLVACRHAHPTWGARKLRARLAADHPALAWPAPSTITTFLHTEGLIRLRARRRPAGTAASPQGRGVADEPNALWTIDYKGQFRTRDGRWCYPLTIVDAASRFLLACVAHRTPSTTAVRDVLHACFRTYGMPTMILSDMARPLGRRGPRAASRA
jgi:transposase InsO family protein